MIFLKHTLFISSFEDDDIEDIDPKLMHKYIIDDFENYWFSDTNDTEIQYFEDNELMSGLTIGANKVYGIYLRYVNLNTSEEKLSLYDETKVNEVEDAANCCLYVSTGCFLPKETAWEVIKYFLETGKASDKIRWISPDDIPENGNYF